jgi:hypothetical protein
MWLYIIAAVLLILGIAGGVLTGGIFTIVILPLGVIALVTAFVVSLWVRSQQGGPSDVEETPASQEAPLPTGHSNAATAPSTPEDLVNARREAQ